MCSLRDRESSWYALFPCPAYRQFMVQGWIARWDVRKMNATTYRTLTRSFNVTSIFCWLPSHMEIMGNERVDVAAKAAFSLPDTPCKIPYSDFKPLIAMCIRDIWQTACIDDSNNKLRQAQSLIGVWPLSCRTIRREEVILSRGRIGRTKLTHLYLLKGDTVNIPLPFNISW